MSDNEVEFRAWQKIGRENPFKVTITEKLDGTNACVIIQDGKFVGAQSRKRLLSLASDNFGFFQWCIDNQEDLESMGDGYHFGEWVGPGIQKNPHNLEEKTLFLFNTFRWNKNNPNLPNCCRVVPIIFEGMLEENIITDVLNFLIADSERVGYTPEGIVVYYHAFRKYTKHTIKSPDGKWCK